MLSGVERSVFLRQESKEWRTGRPASCRPGHPRGSSLLLGYSRKMIPPSRILGAQFFLIFRGDSCSRRRSTSRTADLLRTQASVTDSGFRDRGSKLCRTTFPWTLISKTNCPRAIATPTTLLFLSAVIYNERQKFATRGILMSSICDDDPIN